jgi:hypothetical protein
MEMSNFYHGSISTFVHDTTISYKLFGEKHVCTLRRRRSGGVLPGRVRAHFEM